MDKFENNLREALREPEPSEDLAGKVMARVAAPKRELPFLRRWREALLIAVPLIVALVFVSVTVLRNARIHPLAVLESDDGVLYRLSGGTPAALKTGGRIVAGQILRSDGDAVLALADGSRVEMRSKSELSLQTASDGLLLQLNDGSVIVTAAKQHNGHLYVQTKDVTVSVIGTVFFVNAEQAGSRVAVIQGEVHVQQGPSEKKLRPGQQVATNPLMESHLVSEEISWSRNVVAHLALLQQSAGTPPATAAKLPAFEVASIKPVKWETRMIIGGGCHGTDTKYSGAFGIAPPPLGRCVLTRVTLKRLIQTAYGFFDSPNADSLMAGGPNWLDSDTFNVEAKAEDPPPAEAQLRLMLQTLLADRFKLRVHTETKGDIPGFALVVSKDGPKFKEAAGNEEHPGLRGGVAAQFIGTRVPMSMLANVLSRRLGRPVEDKTNLTATYDFALKWTPGDNEVNPLGKFNLPPEVLAQLPKSEHYGPSIFTALQDQLGLRLEAQQVPREILVIDNAEKPSEN